MTLNRHQRRKSAAGHGGLVVHAGGLPRSHAPKPANAPKPPAEFLGIPLAKLVSVLLKPYGAGGIHVTAENLRELDALGVQVQTQRAPDGGIMLRAVATKEAPLIEVASRIPAGLAAPFAKPTGP